LPGSPQEARVCWEGIPGEWSKEVLHGGIPRGKLKLPKPPTLPDYFHGHRFQDICQNSALRVPHQLC
jgi:hypothetical protein